MAREPKTIRMKPKKKTDNQIVSDRIERDSKLKPKEVAPFDYRLLNALNSIYVDDGDFTKTISQSFIPALVRTLKDDFRKIVQDNHPDPNLKDTFIDLFFDSLARIAKCKDHDAKRKVFDATNEYMVARQKFNGIFFSHVNSVENSKRAISTMNSMRNFLMIGGSNHEMLKQIEKNHNMFIYGMPKTVKQSATSFADFEKSTMEQSQSRQEPGTSYEMTFEL